MTLTVLNVAYPLATVTDAAAGGAEQVLAAIDRALVDAGARSIVIASEGSRTRGILHATPALAPRVDEGALTAAREAHARAILEVLNHYEVEIVHFHGVDYHTYLPGPGVTALATLHLAHCWYPWSAVAPTRANTFVHCVSEWQRQFFPTSPAMLPTIGNGVQIPVTPPMRDPDGYVVSLGRICPEKGFHLALDAARRAGVPMKLAGRVFPYPAHERYFATEILPRLSLDREFIGVIGPRAKESLFAGARCVLVPSRVPETSSLVTMEALAAGLPVIAFPSGALVEIVEHGVTGFIVHDEREMAEAIDAVRGLDHEACRTAAIERFSIGAMTAKYVALYETLTARRRVTPIARHDSSVAIRRSSSYQITELRTEHELRALEPEWQRLCDVAHCTPFQRPEWLVPWWRHFGAGSLRAIVVRHRGALVGVAPLYVRKGWQGDRELAFIGSGNTDYLDVLAVPAHRAEVVTAMVEAVVARADDWDRCDLGPLSPRSPLLAVMSPRGWSTPRAQLDVCPTLCVPSPRGDIMRAVSPRFLSQLLYARRRLTREHRVAVSRATVADAGTHFAILRQLHAARWTERGSEGVLTDTVTIAFHEEVVRRMSASGHLRLYVMFVDEKPAAAFYGVADKQRWYYYLGGFDPVFDRYSVGSQVVLHALEHAASDYAMEFNFLRGGEPYKRRWGTVDGAVYRLQILPQESAESGQAA